MYINIYIYISVPPVLPPTFDLLSSGMASCILLSEKLLPFLSGQNAVRPEVQKKKMQ